MAAQSRSAIKYLLFVALLTAPSTASAVAVFNANVNGSTPTSAISASACSVGPTNTAQPGSVGIICGDSGGVGNAGAISNVGHVGAFANATAIGQGGLATFQGNALWQDDFVVNGNPGVVPVSVNFGIAGSLGGLGADFSDGDFSFGIGVSGVGVIGGPGPQSVFQLIAFHSTQGDSCTSIPDDFCGTGLPGHFVTPTFNVIVGVPFTLGFNVTADAMAVGAGASGSANAFHSLDLLLNQPVFNLSDPTLTVQGGGDCIVDNIFVCGNGSGTHVPEPSTLALFGVGLVGLGAIRRRRKARA